MDHSASADLHGRGASFGTTLVTGVREPFNPEFRVEVNVVGSYVDDPELEIVVVSGSEASEISSSDSDGFHAIAAAIGEVFPEAPVAPGLVLGGTDSRHYGRIADDSYRFGPLDLGREDTARFHGVNERIAVVNYTKAIDFYASLIRSSAAR